MFSNPDFYFFALSCLLLLAMPRWLGFLSWVRHHSNSHLNRVDHSGMISSTRIVLIAVFILVNSPVVLARTSRLPNVTAEATISVDNPYVQQTVIYTVRAVSQTNVLEFTLDPPTIPGAVLEPLEDKPRTYARPTANGQYVVNEYRYTLTPLVAGRIEVPPTKLSGKAESPDQNQYQGTARRGRGISFQTLTKPIIFRSRRMPDNATQPWLPIQALDLVSEGEIQPARRVGEPFTLSLWLRAIGVRGQRLPSLVELLHGADFRIYAEKAVEYWQDATPDGNAVRGQRHETLTIVPLKAGTLRLPAVHIPWWNTIKDQANNLEWQTPEITVTDPNTPTDSWKISAWLFVLPAAVIFYLLGWWSGRNQSISEKNLGDAKGSIELEGIETSTGLMGILQRVFRGWRRIADRLHLGNTNIPQRLKLGYQATLTYLKVHFANVLKERIIPIPHRPFAARFHRFIARLLPATFHTRRLSHHIQSADRLDTIAEAVRIYATTVFELPKQSPLTVIAQAIHKNHPELNGPVLLSLFHQLDSALYGAGQGDIQKLDIERWKNDFREMIRPLRHHRRRIPDMARNGLPPLNPGT